MGRDEEPERSTESADGRPDRERSDPTDDRPPTLEPTTDEATIELIRDAVDVARGEFSDEVFSEKYGVGDGSERVDDGNERVGDGNERVGDGNERVDDGNERVDDE